MACKSCGASKVTGRFCSYCRNPSMEQPNIYYVDVSDMSTKEVSVLIKWYEKAVYSGVSTIWPHLCQTPTHGKIMSI